MCFIAGLVRLDRSQVSLDVSACSGGQLWSFSAPTCFVSAIDMCGLARCSVAFALKHLAPAQLSSLSNSFLISFGCSKPHVYALQSDMPTQPAQLSAFRRSSVQRNGRLNADHDSQKRIETKLLSECNYLSPSHSSIH